ncbi:hypothetical protein [Pseudohongiella spirulinae]|uniref:Phage protein n=1 Tax=Pseudohongiella spirulinae TaxID=1249552 RepID=A0A0S2KE42_9GAMM|nr:hypothetical protein [Pseudohongiella spirulinae]ALO46576.1 hypothetical protein PS2015_1930 [Pseudohongiella spirulinae]
MFDLMSQTAVAAFGGALEYTQSTNKQSFQILIERNLEIIDDDTGAGQYINAAVWANVDFPFSKPVDGDLIVAPDRTWRVVRKVSDDGHVTTVEIR